VALEENNRESAAMSDDINHKVISLFQRHRHDESAVDVLEEVGDLATSPDGFVYFSVKHEQEGLLAEQNLTDVAVAKHYIVKMMEVHHESHTVRVNNYDVPGDRLEDFLLSLSQRPGKILEIKQFIPDHMA
jgi:hypothetical protein